MDNEKIMMDNEKIINDFVTKCNNLGFDAAKTFNVDYFSKITNKMIDLLEIEKEDKQYLKRLLVRYEKVNANDENFLKSKLGAVQQKIRETREDLGYGDVASRLSAKEQKTAKKQLKELEKLEKQYSQTILEHQEKVDRAIAKGNVNKEQKLKTRFGIEATDKEKLVQAVEDSNQRKSARQNGDFNVADVIRVGTGEDSTILNNNRKLGKNDNALVRKLIKSGISYNTAMQAVTALTPEAVDDLLEKRDDNGEKLSGEELLQAVAGSPTIDQHNKKIEEIFALDREESDRARYNKRKDGSGLLKDIQERLNFVLNAVNNGNRIFSFTTNGGNEQWWEQDENLVASVKEKLTQLYGDDEEVINGIITHVDKETIEKMVNQPNLTHDDVVKFVEPLVSSQLSQDQPEADLGAQTPPQNDSQLEQNTLLNILPIDENTWAMNLEEKDGLKENLTKIASEHGEAYAKNIDTLYSNASSEYDKYVGASETGVIDRTISVLGGGALDGVADKLKAQNPKFFEEFADSMANCVEYLVDHIKQGKELNEFDYVTLAHLQIMNGSGSKEFMGPFRDALKARHIDFSVVNNIANNGINDAEKAALQNVANAIGQAEQTAASKNQTANDDNGANSSQQEEIIDAFAEQNNNGGAKINTDATDGGNEEIQEENKETVSKKKTAISESNLKEIFGVAINIPADNKKKPLYSLTNKQAEKSNNYNPEAIWLHEDIRGALTQVKAAIEFNNMFAKERNKEDTNYTDEQKQKLNEQWHRATQIIFEFRESLKNIEYASEFIKHIVNNPQKDTELNAIVGGLMFAIPETKLKDILNEYNKIEQGQIKSYFGSQYTRCQNQNAEITTGLKTRK